ncbi:MAG: hypothetical protein ABI603_04265 [Acidobacteriota bacterium]
MPQTAFWFVEDDEEPQTLPPARVLNWRAPAAREPIPEVSDELAEELGRILGEAIFQRFRADAAAMDKSGRGRGPLDGGTLG